MQELIIARAKELLTDGTVNRVVGWRKGELGYDITPTVFNDVEDLEKNFIYNVFSAPNLSKYLINIAKLEGKTLVILKPCDSFSFVQLLTEYKINRDSVYVLAVECNGKIDTTSVLEKTGDGLLDVEDKGEKIIAHTLYGDKEFTRDELMAERCLNCKSKKHSVYDELIGEEGEVLDSHRFDMVEKLEKMSSDERYEFWRGELSRCIRCNACRNVCPACTCTTCIFDNEKSGVNQKAANNSFEENMFHIIRAFHVAGRCTDCGECSRVCPQNIPLHLLNRKFIKDINSFYGEYQAGLEVGQVGPLTSYQKVDPETTIVSNSEEK